MISVTVFLSGGGSRRGSSWSYVHALYNHAVVHGREPRSLVDVKSWRDWVGFNTRREGTLWAPLSSAISRVCISSLSIWWVSYPLAVSSSLKLATRSWSKSLSWPGWLPYLPTAPVWYRFVCTLSVCVLGLVQVIFSAFVHILQSSWAHSHTKQLFKSRERIPLTLYTRTMSKSVMKEHARYDEWRLKASWQSNTNCSQSRVY